MEYFRTRVTGRIIDFLSNPMALMIVLPLILIQSST
uniref:Uncharacterized protein n=1 Tax=Tetranychus urticae TaxID=32264 RepID=T1KQ31_TETUR